MRATRRSDGPDDHDHDPFAQHLMVSELIDARYDKMHMECLRFCITLRHLHEQRLWYGQANLINDDEDDRIDRHEFECELNNFHDLLVCRHLRDVQVLEFARRSIQKYVDDWRGAREVDSRWWSPRKDKGSALTADLQMVVPGIWIGSSVSMRPEHEELLGIYRIRHVVRCESLKPDTDDDYLYGAKWATERSIDDEADRYPVITSHPESSEERWKHHSITIMELGRVEFLVRRREKTLHRGSNTGWTKISEFLQRLLSHEDVGLTDQFKDTFEGVLIQCDSGNSSSIAVCLALLMTEYWLPYELALRVVKCARRHVAPSLFLQHQLQAYGLFLEQQRHGQTYPIAEPRID